MHGSSTYNTLLCLFIFLNSSDFIEKQSKGCQQKTPNTPSKQHIPRNKTKLKQNKKPAKTPRKSRATSPKQRKTRKKRTSTAPTKRREKQKGKKTEQRPETALAEQTAESDHIPHHQIPQYIIVI